MIQKSFIHRYSQRVANQFGLVLATVSNCEKCENFAKKCYFLLKIVFEWNILTLIETHFAKATVRILHKGGDLMATKKSKWPRARQLWFCTNVYALNGNKILDLDDCERICKSKIKLIDKYAIGLHDADEHDVESIKERESHRKQLYMERYQAYAEDKGVAKSEASESGYVYDEDCKKNADADVDFYYPVKQLNDEKEPHIHCVIKLKYARCIDEIARWFGIPVTMIDIKSGHHVFEDCATYLVHKKQPEKHNYEAVIDSHIRANFDYQEWLSNQAVLDILHEKYHMHVDDINDIVNKVANDGLSLREVESMVSTPVFLRNKKLFRDARDHYISTHMEMPANRFVFYVDSLGQSGAGKSIATKALCKQYAKDYGADITKDMGELKEYIYKAGGKGVAWQRYDGQPIVYIDDREAVDLLMEFNGHDGVKNLFEPYPDKESVDIKYGDAIIVAKYIIINGIQPFEAFIDGLNGSYVSKDGTRVESDKDRGQYARRITGIVRILEDDIVELLFNSGVMRNTREYERYESIKIMSVNFQRVAERLSGDARFQIESKTFDSLVEESRNVEERFKNKITSIDDIPDEFKHYGDAISAEELFQIKLDEFIEMDAQRQLEEYEKLLHEQALKDEYYSVFYELWISVHADDLTAGKISLASIPSFETWKDMGCPTAWKDDGSNLGAGHYYRPLDNKETV